MDPLEIDADLSALAGSRKNPPLIPVKLLPQRISMTNVIVTATGAKIGSKGKVANNQDKMGQLLATLPKGDARKVRKQLREKGLGGLAGARRAA